MINIDKRIKFKKLCGCYLLWKNGFVVYVGQSINIIQRIAQHSTIKDFDEYSYIEADSSCLNELEAELIIQYNPPLNLAMPQNKRYKRVDPNWIFVEVKPGSVPALEHPIMGMYYKTDDIIKREKIHIHSWDEFGNSICADCEYGKKEKWRPFIKDAYCPRCGSITKVSFQTITVENW